MVNDEASAMDTSTPDPGDTEERNMEQLMAAADSAAEPPASISATPDKDSSTITIFNENSEVIYFGNNFIIWLLLLTF